MIRLRPHHLLCLQTYIGRGYCPAFVINMDAICARLGAGEPARIVSGADDICTPIRNSEHDHCDNASVTWRDDAAAVALDLMPGDVVIVREKITGWRKDFAAHRNRTACDGCPWYDLCTDIAASGFPDIMLTAS